MKCCVCRTACVGSGYRQRDGKPFCSTLCHRAYLGEDRWAAVTAGMNRMRSIFAYIEQTAAPITLGEGFHP